MKQKLIVLASTFPGTFSDGTPAFVLDLAWQQAKEFDVTVITPMVPGAAAFETIASPNGETEISVVRYRYFIKRFEDLASGAILDNLKARKSRLIQVPFMMIGLFAAVKKQTRKIKPAAIHAHWVIPQGLIATIAAPNVPLLVTTHGGDIYALNTKPLLKLKRWVFARANAITTVNSDMKAQLVSWGQPADKILLLPMGVDTEQVQQIAKTKTKVAGQLLVIGRLVEKKGIEYLLDAMRLLLAKGTHKFHLVVIGDGPIRAELELRAKGLPVEFRGQQSRTSVLEAIAESEIMVIPSVTAANGDQEGLPVTLLEGGAGQICVIASRLPGIDEVIIDGESGILVAQRNSAALADALESALSDKKMRAKYAAGIATNVKRYDINTIGAAYANALVEISRN